MTGMMLDAGAAARLEKESRTAVRGGSSVPSPHFRCRPKFTLEILKGDCSLRRRAFETQQIFIGSDEDCELRLDHAGIAPVVAVIRILEEGVWIEPCRLLHELKVNRTPTRGSWLQDGDEIEIAPFLLKAHLGLQGNPSALELPATDKQTPNISEPVRWIIEDRQQSLDLEQPDPAELSAAELLDQIESDLQLIERDERQKREGEDSLLRAIRARQAALAVGRDPSPETEPASGRISIRFHAESDSESAEAHSTSVQAPGNSTNLGRLIAELHATLEKLGDLPALAPSTLELETLLHKLEDFDHLPPPNKPRAIA